MSSFVSFVFRMVFSQDNGVAFHIYRNALKAAGHEPEDMHGFITVVPSGFAGIVYPGYQYINPTPLSTRDIHHAE